MSIKNRIKNIFSGKKSISSVIPLQAGSFLEYAMGGSGRVTASQAMAFYRGNSAVATAVDKIASAVEQITPVLLTKEDNVKVYDTNHEAVKNLLSPNPFETYKEFIGKLSRHYLLTHNGYFLQFGGLTKPPHEMYATKPQSVAVLGGGDNFAGKYFILGNEMGAGEYSRQTDIKGESVKYMSGALKEFYHIIGFSSRGNDFMGDSPLEAAAMDVKQQIHGKKHNLSLLNNGGRLSLIVSFKEEFPDDDEHRQRKKRIQEDLGGSSNTGKIAVVSAEDVSIKEVGTSNKDMDFSTLDKTSEQAIYKRYGIPLPLVSTDAATYNNIESALFDFYENTVLPIYDTLFSGISKVYLPRYGLDITENVLTYDPESINIIIRQTLKELEQRKKINIESHNELRSILPNREPIENGDIVYQNASMVPVGMDLMTLDNYETPEEIAARMNDDS